MLLNNPPDQKNSDCNTEAKKPDFDTLAGLFSLLSNPIRLQILDYLLSECCKRTEGCCSVSDIYLELQLPQPLISKHLKILKKNGLLDFTRQGSRILYYFAPCNCLQLIRSFVDRFTGIGETCCK